MRVDALCVAAIAAMATALPAAADTLDSVRARGTLRCGISQGLPGFSTPDAGTWRGLDTDFCRAVAAAVFGDAHRVTFVPLSAKERFTALQSGEIDLLSRNTTWTASRDLHLGLDFVGVIFYDGQGFMVPKALGVTELKDLDGATICTNAGTTSELNLADAFRSRGLTYKPLVFEKHDEVLAAYEAGRCDAYTTDISGLSASMLRLKDRSKHMLLKETISKEPLGPAVRAGDARWADVVRWTLFALIEAEELGLTQANVAAAKSDPRPPVRRLLGNEGGFGTNLGLKPDWALHVIHSVGNYGEIFARNVGQNSPLGLERGLNALWRDGGLMYAPPFR